MGGPAFGAAHSGGPPLKSDCRLRVDGPEGDRWPRELHLLATDWLVVARLDCINMALILHQYSGLAEPESWTVNTYATSDERRAASGDNPLACLFKGSLFVLRSLLALSGPSPFSPAPRAARRPLSARPRSAFLKRLNSDFKEKSRRAVGQWSMRWSSTPSCGSGSCFHKKTQHFKRRRIVVSRAS